jgi:hypothetical protein
VGDLPRYWMKRTKRALQRFRAEHTTHSGLVPLIGVAGLKFFARGGSLVWTSNPQPGRPGSSCHAIFHQNPPPSTYVNARAEGQTLRDAIEEGCAQCPTFELSIFNVLRKM